MGHVVSGFLFALALFGGFGIIMGAAKFLSWVQDKYGDRGAWIAFGFVMFMIVWCVGAWASSIT